MKGPMSNVKKKIMEEFEKLSLEQKVRVINKIRNKIIAIDKGINEEDVRYYPNVNEIGFRPESKNIHQGN
jgi:hypothetical protein